MSNYLYKTIIYKDTTNIYSLNITQNNIDKTDFETNRKSSSQSITEIFISETSFITEESYANFTARIISPITWADVKYIENSTKYILYLIQ